MLFDVGAASVVETVECGSGAADVPGIVGAKGEITWPHLAGKADETS